MFQNKKICRRSHFMPLALWARGELNVTMASFFGAAARRATAYSYSSSVLALPALAGTSSFVLWKTTSTECEAADKKKISSLKTRMTSIGRFSLESQTAENPSVPTFFLALSGDTPLTIPDFCRLWKERNMENRHARFHSRISKDHPGHFEPVEDPVEKHCTETVFPMVYRTDLMHRIQTFLLQEIEVWQQLWQLQLSHGPLGKSGAISKAKAQQILKQNPNSSVESLLLFRFHHALADGVSIMAALTDLCDEAQEFRGMVVAEMEKRKRLRQSLGFLQKLARALQMLVWFCYGSLRAMLYQSYLYWTTPSCPFDQVKNRLSNAPIGRSVSWCDAAPIDQVKLVAKSMGKHVTINDVIVSCVSFAVAKQLEEHEHLYAERTSQYEESVPKFLNVAIPVHLGGGVLLPGQSIGNNIGAFVARVPGANTLTASDRLETIHDTLYDIKRTPAPLLSHWFAKFCSSYLSSSMTQRLFKRANVGASFVVSNAGRGPPKKMHLDGRTVESATGFLPLPPGIPIGIVAGSYAGTLSLSVTAEQWAVPDADKFLLWVLEEYQRLCDEAQDRIQK